MRCIICDHSEWENVDTLRLKPQGMEICKHCGFVSYPSKWKTEEEIKAHYRNDYRTTPSSANLFSCQRKVHFHKAFLNDLISEWNEKKRENIEVCEIGAAFGMALAFLRDSLPGSKVYGTELTTTFRRVAKSEYNLDLTEDFDSSRKYDLIMSYKVAEHQLDADKILRKYVECLKDDGFMYISVPTWFDQMCNFGMSGFDIEYYYDPNHINVWTRKLFETLLNKVGLKIIKKDYVMYDSTYLCQRDDSLMAVEKQLESPQEVRERMYKIKEAYIACEVDKNYKAAIDLYPDFPNAYINDFEANRRPYFEQGWDWIKANVLEKALANCNRAADVLILAADVAMRARKWEEAIGYCEECLQVKPENPPSLNMLINIMRELALESKDEKAKIHYFKQAKQIADHMKEVSWQHQREAIDYSFKFASMLPFEKSVS